MVDVIRGGDPTIANRVIENDRTAGWASHIIPRDTNGRPERNSTRKIGSRTMPFASAASRRFVLTDYYDSGLIDIRATPIPSSNRRQPGVSFAQSFYPDYSFDSDLSSLTGTGRRAWVYNDRFKYFSKAIILFSNYGNGGVGDSNVALFDPNNTETLAEGVYGITPIVNTSNLTLQMSANPILEVPYQRLELGSDGMLNVLLRGNHRIDVSSGNPLQFYYRMRLRYESRAFFVRPIPSVDTYHVLNINIIGENNPDRVSSMRVIIF